MHEIFLDRARSIRTCSGSRVFLWGARLPACGFRLLAETDFLLPLALDEFTIPVRSKTRRGELGLWRLAKTDFLRLGSAPGCNASPARTLGALAERTLSNRTRTLRVPRKRTFLRVFLRDCVIA